MPPVELPKYTPASAASLRPACRIASRAAATAKRSVQGARRAPAGAAPNGTSAARWVRCRVPSKRVIVEMAGTPRSKPSQSGPAPHPKAVTAPSPVTTIVGSSVPFGSAPGMRVAHGGEAGFDVGGERGDRRERFPADLVALDAERELLLQRDDQLEGVHGVQPQPIPEQRHVIVDARDVHPLEMELLDEEVLDPLCGRRIVGHGVDSSNERG